jgi:hypothetical protein
MRDIRKWYKKPPYDIKEIVDLMPGEFVDDYDKLPNKARELILKKCF